MSNLIPRVPQRLNYVLWIEDLLNRQEKATGIDIGCGVSCIFGFLACKMNKQWKMIGTDVSDDTLNLAQSNIDKNKLNDQITCNKNIFPSE